MSEKIEKLLEEISSLTLVEASELKKAMEEKFGVTAAAPVMMAAGAAPAAAAPAEEEQTEFTVELTDTGAQKLQVIKVIREITSLGLKEAKVIREITSLGLKEAKDLVEGAPSVVKENVSKEEANDIKKKLEEAGAKVTLK
jgi:large subunit ribosomal protein L7/L12